MASADPREALGALMAQSGASYAALSRLLGRNAAYLQQFVTRGSPRRLAERDCRLLAAYFGVDEEVLGADPGGAPPAVRVPRLDISASAGPGALVEAERRIGDLGVDAALMARLNVRTGDLSVIRASGDSMSPTIADGDELLVDRSDRRLGRAGRIFVIKIDGALLVKRVSKPGLAVRVASDNPAYPPVEVAAVEVVGRVVWLSRALR